MTLLLPAAVAERAARFEMPRQPHALFQLQLAAGTTSEHSPVSADKMTTTNNITVSAAGTSKAQVIDKIVFVKLHKVGSSTMTSILHHFCELHNKTCFVYPAHIGIGALIQPHDLDKIASAITSSHRPALDVWPNHVVMKASTFDRLIPGNFKIAFFREPVDRFVSGFWAESAEGVLDLMDSLKRGSPKSTDCGPFASAIQMALQIKPEEIDHLDLAMLTEQYDLSLMLLRRAVGWSLFDMLYRRMKTSSNDIAGATTSFAAYLSTPAHELNSATREYKRKCVQPDEAVYKQAKRKFQRQLDSLSPVDHQRLLDDVATFQSARDKLVDCCESNLLDSYCTALAEDNEAWNRRYQNLGSFYTSKDLSGDMPDAAITHESSCKTLVKSLLP